MPFDRFDPGKKVQFSTYAEYRIKGAMLDELRALDWVPRSVRRNFSRLDKAYWELEKEKGRPVEDEEMAEALGVTLADFHGLLNDTNRVSLLDIENLPRQLAGLKDDELLQLLRDDEHRDPAFQLSLLEVKKILAQAIERLSQEGKDDHLALLL